jgi:drug/metabolite transporter (DMT)-like permease
MKVKKHLGADAAILLTTLVWGSTFAVARDILDAWPPLAYLAVRMPIAALLFAALFPRQVFGASREAWRAGATLGALIGVAFVGQTVGLVFTTPAKSAFVSGITTPLIPLAAYLLFRARPSRENLAGVVLASVGGALILAPAGAGRVNTGDIITLATTAVFATHVSLMSVYARRFDVRQLSALQVVVASALTLSAWLVLRAYVSLSGAPPAWTAREAAPLAWSAPVVWQLLYQSTVATVGVFLIWTWGQARMSATHAAVIFGLEPVFATLFAVALRGSAEWTGGRATAGALLVVAGVIVSELRWGGEGQKAEGSNQKAVGEEREVVES